MEAVPLSTRERQRRDTRHLILQAGLEEIAQGGLAKARIERIAQRAGVTRPTIYAHFPRKEDFLRTLQTHTEEVALRELRGRVGDASGAELVHRLADAVFDLVAAGHPVLRRESFALIIREPQQMNWETNPLFGFLTARFAEAQASGELASDPPAEELTRLLATAFLGFLIVESEPLEARRQAAHRVLELLIRGVT